MFICCKTDNPANDDELGPKIGLVDSIHVNASTLSFFVADPIAKNYITRRATDSSCTGESSDDSFSSLRDGLAFDDVYCGTKLVQTQFEDWVDCDGHDEDENKPIVYTSELGAITICLSSDGLDKSNLAEVLRHEDDVHGLTPGTSASATGTGNDIVNFGCAEKHQSNLLRLQIPVAEFESFCHALTDRDIVVVKQVDAENNKSLDDIATHEEDIERGCVDQVEFNTRRILPARLQDVQTPESVSAQPERSDNSLDTFDTVDQKDGTDAATTTANTKEREERGLGNNAKPSSPLKGKSKKESSSSKARTKPSRANVPMQEAKRSKSIGASTRTTAKRKLGNSEEDDDDDDFGRLENGSAPDSPGEDGQARRSKHVAVCTEPTARNARKKQKAAREVTPLPLAASGGLVHKQTSTSPRGSAFANTELSDGEILDTKFSRVESNPNSLESISARCCALAAAKGVHRQEDNGLKLELPLPMSQTDGENNLAEDVIAYDEALIRAVDALNNVNRLAKKIEGACAATPAADESESAFGWIDKPYELVRSKQQKWASQRKDVEKQLYHFLLQRVTSEK